MCTPKRFKLPSPSPFSHHQHQQLRTVHHGISPRALHRNQQQKRKATKKKEKEKKSQPEIKEKQPANPALVTPQK
jgi:hypothetical protein